jgi:hypothetical protein
MRRHLLYGKLPSLQIRIIVQIFSDEGGPLKLMQRVSTSMSPFSAFFHQGWQNLRHAFGLNIIMKEHH